MPVGDAESTGPVVTRTSTAIFCGFWPKETVASTASEPEAPARSASWTKTVSSSRVRNAFLGCPVLFPLHSHGAILSRGGT
jgi:hypothetical protein